jgi:hypothetical protein
MRVTILALTFAAAALAAPAHAQTDAGLGSLTRVQPGRSKAVTSSDPDLNSNFDRPDWIHPGETLTLADVAGPGVITHIWVTFVDARPDWAPGGGYGGADDIVLRMYWDGAAEPAVEAPLGDFFAAGFGVRREVRSVPIQVPGGDAYNSFWQMPFYRHARITVTNDGTRNVRAFYYQVDYTSVPSLPAGTPYFCAQYRREFPEQQGGDYLVLDAAGRGHYVGTVMSIQSRSPFWPGEGDARIYVDGDARPTIQGTGTEDYFLSAWGLEEHSFPYAGAPYLSDDPSSLGARMTMYRWHIADPIRFTRSLRVTFEHTGWIPADESETGKIDPHVEREDDIATVAFWYQVGQPKRFTAFPGRTERAWPNLDRVVEGQELLTTAMHSAGTLEVQRGFDWTGAGQLFFVPSSDSAYLEVRFSAPDTALTGLVLRLTHAPDYGRWRILLDGRDVTALDGYPDWQTRGAQDFYGRDVTVRDLYLGSFSFAPGSHVIRFEAAGRSGMSTGGALGLDSVRLRQRWHKLRKPLLPATPRR